MPGRHSMTRTEALLLLIRRDQRKLGIQMSELSDSAARVVQAVADLSARVGAGSGALQAQVDQLTADAAAAVALLNPAADQLNALDQPPAA